MPYDALPMTESALLANRFVPLPSPFPLYRGGVILGGGIAYESWGSLNTAKDNAILLFTGLSPSAHAASSHEDRSVGWWERLIGPGAAFDVRRYHIICINSLGSCFGSTGPTSVNPVTGLPYGESFPQIELEEIASAGCAVLDYFGIERAEVVVGPSLGGSVVAAFAALYPGKARRMISISGTLAPSAYAIALRSIQREAVMQDPVAGLRLARKLGTVSYRSAKELSQRFGRQPSSAGRDFAVQDYLDQQADKFAGSFDPVSYLRLSRAIDRFDLYQHGQRAMLFQLAKLEAALVIGVQEDQLFPIEEQAVMAGALQAAGVPTRFEQLESVYGHDAFLVEQDRFGTLIERWLQNH